MIRRPKLDELDAIHAFFELVLKDTFIKNDIMDLVEIFNDEVADKKWRLDQDITSSGVDRYFLIATIEGQIVGTIEYGPSGDLIDACTQGALADLVEIGTVFVHPEFQRKGIGNRMLNSIISVLKNRGIEQFCMDSGYESAQRVWTKKFGVPKYCIKDYWGEGADHMIWSLNVEDLRIT